MEALTPCWYTRVHRPVRARTHGEDGSVSSTCRYCNQPLISWNRRDWSLDTGINMSRLAEQTCGRMLTLVDPQSDMVVRRIALGHLESEDAITAFKAEIAAQFGLDEPDNTLELRDSAIPGRRLRTKPPATRAASRVGLRL